MFKNLFKKKTNVSEEELGHAFFYWANSCTKDVINTQKFLDEIDKNDLYNELLILNMFLITQFTPQDKIPYNVYDSMYMHYWEIISESVEHNQEIIKEFKSYQKEMIQKYLEIMKKHINENYIEKLANYFIYHVTKEQHSSYSFEVLEIATSITATITSMPKWLDEYKIKF